MDITAFFEEAEPNNVHPCRSLKLSGTDLFMLDFAPPGLQCLEFQRVAQDSSASMAPLQINIFTALTRLELRGFSCSFRASLLPLQELVLLDCGILFQQELLGFQKFLSLRSLHIEEPTPQQKCQSPPQSCPEGSPLHGLLTFRDWYSDDIREQIDDMREQNPGLFQSPWYPFGKALLLSCPILLSCQAAANSLTLFWKRI